jgi:hypothetical protein
MPSSLLFGLPTDAFGSPALINPGQELGQQSQPDDGGLPHKGSAILMESLDEFNESLDKVVEGEMYYDGDAGDDFASEKVRMLLAKSGVEDVDDLNYAKTPVDAVVNKLQIRAITCTAGDDANVEEDAEAAEAATDKTNSPGKEGESAADKAKKKIAERAQEKLDAIRKRNQLNIEEGELFLKASKHGDAYLFVWPVVKAPADDEDAYEDAVPIDQENTGTVVGVDVFVNAADTARMFYDPENPLRPTHVLKTWHWVDPEMDAARDRATLYFKDRIERWVTKVGEKDLSKPESWVPYVVDGQVWPAPNPYKRLPFFHFRTKRTYGVPEHKAAYGPQRLINKLVSAHAVTIDFQSFPQRYALSNPRLDDVLGNLIDPDNPEDDDDDPEGNGRSQLRADPSAVWKLPGVTSVGQFAPADPQVFMAPLDRYIKAMAETTGTPLDQFTGYSQPPSGEARKAANEPLYEKATNRRNNYGGVLADAYEFALELMGESDIEVTVQWKPVESATGLDDWTVAEKKIANGVPLKQVLVEMGYPEDQVDEWLLDESGADLTRRVLLLNSIGTAVQAIGAGVALGVVDPEQVGAIIAKVLGVVGEDLPVLDEPVHLRPVQDNAAVGAQNAQTGAQFQQNGPPQPDPYGRTPPTAPPPPPPAPVEVGHQ